MTRVSFDHDGVREQLAYLTGTAARESELLADAIGANVLRPNLDALALAEYVSRLLKRRATALAQGLDNVPGATR